MMASKTIIFITGANTGLGFETVKAFLKAPSTYTILLGSRNIENANVAAQNARDQFPQTSSVLVPVQVDIEDDDSILRASELIAQQYGRLDVLINNAGGQFDQQFHSDKLTMREMWTKSWDVNTTGTYILTNAFVPLLLKSSNPRLMFITSGTSTLGESDNLSLKVNISPTKGWPKQDMSAITAYRSSKTGMNMMMHEWWRTLKEDGVKVWGISPGFLATGLGGNQAKNKASGAQDPSVGANFIRDVTEGRCDKDVGKVVRRDGVQPW